MKKLFAALSVFTILGLAAANATPTGADGFNTANFTVAVTYAPIVPDPQPVSESGAIILNNWLNDLIFEDGTGVLAAGNQNSVENAVNTTPIDFTGANGAQINFLWHDFTGTLANAHIIGPDNILLSGGEATVYPYIKNIHFKSLLAHGSTLKIDVVCEYWYN